jgi:hypothetical protein
MAIGLREGAALAVSAPLEAAPGSGSRRNEDDAIGGAGPIACRLSGVAEDFDACDVVRIDVAESPCAESSAVGEVWATRIAIDLDAIDKYQRIIAGAEGTEPPNPNPRPTSRETIGGKDLNAGPLVHDRASQVTR